MQFDIPAHRIVGPAGELPVLPDLQRVIDASQTGDLTFLVTEYGRPLSVAGFGNKFREWCNEAGLEHCSAHGLRKAAATTFAEHGATAHQLMAWFGWRSLRETIHTRGQPEEACSERRHVAREGQTWNVSVPLRRPVSVPLLLSYLFYLMLCMGWRPVGDSNPCYQRERLVS